MNQFTQIAKYLSKNWAELGIWVSVERKKLLYFFRCICTIVLSMQTYELLFFMILLSNLWYTDESLLQGYGRSAESCFLWWSINLHINKPITEICSLLRAPNLQQHLNYGNLCSFPKKCRLLARTMPFCRIPVTLL